MIAYLWKTANGWKLEIFVGNPVDGFSVNFEAVYASQIEAKRAAALAGAYPWNF